MTTTGEDAAFSVVRKYTVIQQLCWKLLRLAENSPTGAVVDDIIQNSLYGPRVSKEKEGSVPSRQDKMEALHTNVNLLPVLDTAGAQFAEDVEHWRGLMKWHILKHPMVVCYGKPSVAVS